MKTMALLGIAAILPGSLNIVPPGQFTLWVQLCRSDGSTQTVPLPVDRKPSSGDTQLCCVMACHADRCRKRLLREG